MVLADTECLRAAYEAFKARARASPAQRAAVDDALLQAHREALDVLDGKRSRTDLGPFVSVWGILHPEVMRSPANQLVAGVRPKVDGGGAIWGAGAYQVLDPGWRATFTQFVQYLNDKADFGRMPAVLTLPTQASFAVVGDWGTGFYQPGGAQAVAALMAADAPDYTVHLGDTYYAGTNGEEKTNFLAVWPSGTQGSFALNSNHSMYSGGHAYFELTLASEQFKSQRFTSYFAMLNQDWIIVGLDSAYSSPPEGFYMDGALDSDQIEFLKDLAAQAGARRFIVLSHHPGFDLTGTPLVLFDQVTAALGKAPDYWYWGHSHNAVVYKPQLGCLARCVGHGAVPYGFASDLKKAPAVLWFETESAKDAVLPERALNGYVRVTLDGSRLTEAFIGENGAMRWSA